MTTVHVQLACKLAPLYIKGKADDRDATHLDLYGGKLHVPKELTFAFWKGVEILDSTKMKNGLVERRPKFFSMFCDLDMKAPEEISWLDIKTITRLIQESISRFFPDTTNPECVICTSPSKALPDKLVKTGVHLIFPNVIVDDDRALRMRVAIVERLDEWRPSFDWHQAVDDAVYKQSGLKMLGATKKDEERTYDAVATMLADGGIDEEIKTWSLAEKLQRCTIRPADAVLSPGWRVYDGCPLLVTKQRGTAYSRAQTSEKSSVPVNDLAQDLCMQCITQLDREHYKTVRIKSMSQVVAPTTGKKYLQINVFPRAGSNWCGCQRRYHTSSWVYFVVSEEDASIYQKCYSTKCRNYNKKGQHHSRRLPPDLVCKLLQAYSDPTRSSGGGGPPPSPSRLLDSYASDEEHPGPTKKARTD